MNHDSYFNILGPLYFLAFGACLYAAHRLVQWWDDRRAARAEKAAER